MRAPASGCSRTSAHSSSSSGLGLEQQGRRERELAHVVHERAELDGGGGVGVGPELQRDVARVQGDGRRVLGGLGIECRERAHEGDAGGERRAVDCAGRAAAAPWGAEESAHTCAHGRAAQGASGSRASPLPSTTPSGQPLRNGRRPVQAPAVAFVQLTASAVTSRGPNHGPNRGPNHGPIRVRPYDAPSGSRDCIRGRPGDDPRTIDTAFVPHGDPALQAVRTCPEQVIPEALWAPSTDEICPQIPEKRDALGDASAKPAWTLPWAAAGASPRSAGPARFGSFVKESAETAPRP